MGCSSSSNVGDDSDGKNACASVLVLGSYGSGKSTVVKHLQIVYKQFETRESRQLLVPFIRDCTLSHVRAWFDTIADYDLTHPNVIDPACLESLRKFDTDAPLTAESSQILRNLLNDGVFAEVAKHTGPLGDPKDIEHIVHAAARLFEDNYIPSDMDIARIHFQTIGQNEHLINSKQLRLRLCDVGGQLSERKKWSSGALFSQSYDYLIFVVALDCFEQTMHEDSKTNRMTDAIALFTSICKEPIKHKHKILILNKVDLFRERFSASLPAFYSVFPEYKGDHDPDVAIEFVTRFFTNICNAASPSSSSSSSHGTAGQSSPGMTSTTYLPTPTNGRGHAKGAIQLTAAATQDGTRSMTTTSTSRLTQTERPPKSAAGGGGGSGGGSGGGGGGGGGGTTSGERRQSRHHSATMPAPSLTVLPMALIDTVQPSALKRELDMASLSPEKKA